MSDFSDSSHSGVSSPASSLIENFHKKNGTPTTSGCGGSGSSSSRETIVTTPALNGLTVGNCNGSSNGLSNATTTTVGRHINTSLSSSVKETSSTSSQHQVSGKMNGRNSNVKRV
ncbi:unnamed protein product [Ceratitis capitata]|uniref:(Mediterranean fruit fly) hypothetical protein n=1 Tax=Ceratitis capitata TaxID=7213 RepID=A0A811UTR3_CERCA|nr:unnamed protein product [Ceratitis capitata]